MCRWAEEAAGEPQSAEYGEEENQPLRKPAQVPDGLTDGLNDREDEQQEQREVVVLAIRCRRTEGR